MNVIDSALAKDIGSSYQLMSREEEIDCIIKAKAGDHVAQNKLVNSQLKRIVSIARSYSSHVNPVQDLISEGTIGLIHAITMFDLDRVDDIRFGSYAQWWVREQINSVVYDNQLIRMPRSHTKGKKEVRDENGKIVKERIEGARVNSVSINAPVSDDSNAGTFESMLCDDKCLGVDTLIEYTKMMGKLNENLTPREMEMFEARVFDDCTYEQIGEQFGINTREGVRQHINKIFDKAQRICKK